MLLPYVDVWLALTFDSHVHHPAAKTWFDALTDEGCFFLPNDTTRQNLNCMILS
jgi:hypothetical protein